MNLNIAAKNQVILFAVFVIATAGLFFNFIPKTKAHSPPTYCGKTVFSASGSGCPTCPSAPCAKSNAWTCDTTYDRHYDTWSWSLTGQYCNSAEGYRQCTWTSVNKVKHSDSCIVGTNCDTSP